MVYRVDCKLCDKTLQGSDPNASANGGSGFNLVVPTDGSGSSTSAIGASGPSVQEVQQCSVYGGTSGHNLHKRISEHTDSVFRRDKGSALSKHHVKFHPQIEFQSKSDVKNVFEAKLCKSGIRFNTSRYIQEAILID